jgi:UDP-glucose 4-epimerase
MKILVAGGSGFVGGRLAESLSNIGHEVTITYNNKKPALKNHPNIGAVKINLFHSKNLQKVCKGFDFVIYAIGMDAQNCLKDPVGAISVNALGAGNLLNASAVGGASKFVYISTAHVYANPLVGHINERSPIRNMHPYATSHSAGENLVLQLGKRYNIDTTVIRLANSFGCPAFSRPECWSLAVNDFCRQVVDTKKIQIHSDIYQQRDFIPIEEVCRFIANLLDVDENQKKITSIINLGTMRSFTLIQMAKLVSMRAEKLFGYKPKIAYLKKYEANSKNDEKLIYGSLYSTKSDILFKKSINKEIDRLLIFCKSMIRKK